MIMFDRQARMMNIVALWMLLSSLGGAMVLSPEPIVTTPGESSHPLKAAKDASKQSVEYAADAARMTGEGIRHTVASGMQSTGEFAHSAMDAVKDTSQAGLEKIGLATPEKGTFERWESGLQSAKEKAAAAAKGSVESTADAADHGHLSARERLENLKKYGTLNFPGATDEDKKKYFFQSETPSATEIVKDKALGAYDTTKEAAGDAATAVKETVAAAGEKIQEGSHETYKTAEEAATAAKKKLEEAAQSLKERTRSAGAEKSSDGAESVGDLASKIAQSVQENVNAAGSKAYDTAGSARDSTFETMGAAYEYAGDALKSAGGKTAEFVRPGEEEEPDSSYQEKLRIATEQAADILRRKAKDAANFMPNVGQGLSMGGAKPDDDASDLKTKAGEYVEAVKEKTGAYYDSAKERMSCKETRPGDWRETFLDQVGIREEADLSRYDVVVGNVKSLWNGRDWTGPGVFHRGAEEAKAGHRGSDTFSRIRSKLDETFSRGDGSGESKGPVTSLLRWLVYVAAAWVVSSIKTAHLLSFSLTYGTSLWVTFVSGYVLSKALAREQYGIVQSKLFPTYLRLIAVGQALCLVLYMMLHPWTHSSRAEKLQHFNLWAVLMSTLVNIFFLEPRATKTMFEKMKMEKEEGSRAEEEAAKAASDMRETTAPLGGSTTPTKTSLDKINQKFSVLHGWSSTFNLLGLMGETWHLWQVSRALAV